MFTNIINSEKLRNKYTQFWPLMFPPEILDRKYIMPSFEEFTICKNKCERYRRMVFTDEITDCDDFALQFYSEFKWWWSMWKSRTGFAKETEINISRKFNYAPSMGISFGMKFKNEIKKHTVVSVLTTDGFYIFDAISREFYKADNKETIILKVWII